MWLILGTKTWLRMVGKGTQASEIKVCDPYDAVMTIIVPSIDAKQIRVVEVHSSSSLDYSSARTT